MLKGTMYITDNEDVIYTAPTTTGNVKIVSLDEDGILNRDPSILVGTCLLPPVDAMIAEADGNEQLYDTIYSNHLLEPYQQQFISALLAYLYIGGNLLLFLPELGTCTKEKLVYHLYAKYGIHPGIIGSQDPYKANWVIDLKCIPLWLNMIYTVHAISAYDFLKAYPADAQINNPVVLRELVMELHPYEETYNEKVDNILRLHKLIHNNPKGSVINPIEEVLSEC